MLAHCGAVGEVSGLGHTGGFCGVSADVSNFDTGELNCAFAGSCRDTGLLGCR